MDRDNFALRFKGTTILSPHSDDAALSIGGTLCKGILEEPITLVTIFGRSNYLRESGFQSSWEIATETRRNEDIAFTNSLGIELQYLELSEAGLRLGQSFDKVFSDKVYWDEPFHHDLVMDIRRLIDNKAPKVLLAPLGLGLHLDHLLVTRLSREIAINDLPQVIYYEDLPYAAAASENEILKHVSSVCSTLKPIYVSVDHEIPDKLDRLRLYRSQIGEFELSLVEYHAARWKRGRLYERLWSSAPFAGLNIGLPVL
jgi:2'-N-acetylparomamine deacetylase / 2'''-acetyl-6'''-hydroxyneomycin deacetylase